MPIKQQLPFPALPRPLATTVIFCFYEFDYLDVSFKLNIQYLCFRDWINSLSIVSSKFIHVVACDRIFFFLRLNNIPVYVYTTFYLSMYFSTNIRFLPSLGSCKSCCNEYLGANIFLIPCYQVFWLYTQKWDFWIIW